MQPNNQNPSQQISEQQLIELFSRFYPKNFQGLRSSIHDDAAAFCMAGSYAFSIDAAVEGVHFFPEMPPYFIGYRSAVIALSDLVASGAQSFAALLSLKTPSKPYQWFESLSNGYAEALHEYDCPLVGGNVSAGELCLTTQVIGKCIGDYSSRSAAKPGDLVFVTGNIGMAYRALCKIQELRKNHQKVDWHSQELEAYLKPKIPYKFGCSLSLFVNAAIDVSDGLLDDALKLALSSGVKLELDTVTIQEEFGEANLQNLNKGDDYQLLFTTALENSKQVQSLAKNLGIKLMQIGRVRSEKPKGNGQHKSNALAGQASLDGLVDQAGKPLLSSLGGWSAKF